MKKINNSDMVGFVQLIAIIYLVFVLLADIMKWQQLDQTHVTLAICAIVVTTGSLKKLGGRKESKVK
ncbi:hypothetical protein HPA88_03650 [Streptococcus suis]|uniref:hypothetical protein n=1 Tax=Streptococcus TaxID=1301 RepID=UPI0003FBA9E7|nr:hypothetical protein [Streptococcus suis]MBS0685641.1 hypothetical protein [Streptococcus suis]MBS0712503.1 hypothetical protein [Streptococcus suis]MBS8025017.1 hypothetical protein [Streptococcus suis]MCK4041103.1 hypothetical protein [Streptococcus suis]MCL4922164.1 hypothetical protein [Streptococcus suis]